MKKIVFCFFLLSALIAGAQNVGINATGNPPNGSAMLDVDASNKGMLIPRVSLLSTTDVVTVPSPTTSLLVYNTNSGMTGGGVGFYWWNGVMWVALNQAFNQTYSAYSTGGVTTNATWQTIPGMTMTFTVPAGMTGKFIIYADVGILTTSAVNPSGTDVAININGTWTAGSGGYKRVYLRPGAINTENNVFGNAVMKQVKTLAAGVYTIDVRAWQQLTGAGTSTSTVGGASGSVLQGSLIVEMILQ